MSILKKIKTFCRFKAGDVVNINITAIPQNNWLINRCALITGGTSGIGFAIAQKFIASGAKVIITGRSQERIDKASL